MHDLRHSHGSHGSRCKDGFAEYGDGATRLSAGARSDGARLSSELLREHLDVRGFKDIEIIELGSAPLAKSSAKSRIARAVVESTAEVYGRPAIVYPMDPSSGPVGAVCGVSQPATPVASFGTGYAGSNPHGPDENIRIDDFLQSIKLVGRVLHKLAETKSKAWRRSSVE